MDRKEIEKRLAQNLELSPLAEQKVQEAYQIIRNMEKGKASADWNEVEQGENAVSMTEMKGSREQGGRRRYQWLLSPAAAAVCILMVGITAAASVYLLTQKEFLDHVFGNGSRDSIESHTEWMDGNTDPIQVTYPAREYVDTDEKTVERLIGNAVAHPGISRRIGAYTVTLEYVVSDGMSACASWKLECEEGIKAIDVSDPLYNESKGVPFTTERDFNFYLCDTQGAQRSGQMLLDQQNSTENCMYLYEMIPVFGMETEKEEVWTLHMEQYQNTIAEFMRENPPRTVYESRLQDVLVGVLTGEIFKDPNQKIIWEEDISFTVNLVGTQEYQEGETEKIMFQCSPMSMMLSLGNFSENPDFVEYLALRYKDGTEYVVVSRNDGDPVDNTNYTCSYGTENLFMFNRLVDWEKVEEVIVNDRVMPLTGGQK
ncbi:MAG: hypothetical protein Q4C59_08355 [Lachnospiraceae bacterium]|nr:hypothetical protein [Lachnospiraceae bacterium]